jgi:predicted RNA-binding protein with EMAP domain
MDKQMFSALMQDLPGDEFRDEVDYLLEQESFTSEQISALIVKMEFTEDFQALEYFGFGTFKNLVEQSDISMNDIKMISDSVIKMDSESEEWSSTWLDEFIDEELDELRLAIEILEKKIDGADKVKRLSAIAKNLKNRNDFDSRLEILLEVASSKKTPANVLTNLATDPRVAIRLALVENIATPRTALEILALDSYKKIAEKAKVRLES